MTEVVVGQVSAFPDSGRLVVAVDGTEVGVFRRNGKFTAFENVCPHMGGPVCQGKIIARVEEVIAADKTSRGLAFSKDHADDCAHRMRLACRGAMSKDARRLGRYLGGDLVGDVVGWLWAPHAPDHLVEHHR